MKFPRCLAITVVISGVMLLSACQPLVSSHGTVNFASISTVIREDSSGSNTFLLVVPNDPECEIVDLGPAFEQLKSQASTRVYYVSYRDSEYKGYRLTYDFQHPEQIPEQIESLKRAIVEAALAEFPTPDPTSSEFVPPAYAVGLYYSPEQLSLQIAEPSQTLTGEMWETVARINPLLLTGWTTEEPFARQLPETCRAPRFTYELTMPGEIGSFRVANEARPDLLRFSKVTESGRNSIKWTIESQQAADVLGEELKQFIQSEAEQAEERQDQEIEKKMSDLLEGPTYTLTVTSTTPGRLFQGLTRVAAPIVALVASVVAIIAAVLKVRQTLKQDREKTQT